MDSRKKPEDVRQDETNRYKIIGKTEATTYRGRYKAVYKYISDNMN